MDHEDQKDIRRVLGGDIEAIEAILIRNQPFLTRVIARMIPRSDVDEITQRAFISAFERLSTYRADKPFQHWLCKIAVNKCNDFWRERKRQSKKQEKLSGELNQRDTQTIPSDPDRVDEILDLLSPPDRLLMNCLYVEDMSIESTAKHLGWGISNVKVRAFRAKRKLKSLLISRKWQSKE